MENPFKFGTIVEAEYFTNSTRQTNSLLSKLTQHLHLTPLQPSYALAA